MLGCCQAQLAFPHCWFFNKKRGSFFLGEVSINGTQALMKHPTGLAGFPKIDPVEEGQLVA